MRIHRLHTLEELKQWKAKYHASSTLALVPTMGNLHEGHLALIRDARTRAEGVVVSIFVNPTQFSPHEDFDRYPRTLEADIALCETEGVAAVFAPNVENMYPLGGECSRRFAVQAPKALSQRHCGATRDGHFDGVCTVVLKLFNLIQPDVAVFGQKDAQQLAILKAMVKDLTLNVDLIAHPVVRDENGLALSSRNQYLSSPEKQETALALFETLKGVATAFHVLNGKAIPVEKAFELAWGGIQSQYPLGHELIWEYQHAVDADTFEPLETLSANTRLLVAAKLDGVRLIDTLHVQEVLH